MAERGSKESANNEILPLKLLPRYCTSMQNLVVCFTGFTRDEMHDMARLVHYMGGSIRKEITPGVTHLVANSMSRIEYTLVVVLEILIMSRDWIYKTWDRRNETNFSANDPQLIQQNKQKPFFSCHIALVGFSDEDRADMEKSTEENGGAVAAVEDDSATHVVVVDKQSERDLSGDIFSRAYVVRAEWFWDTIQMDARPEERYYSYLPFFYTLPAEHTRNRERKWSNDSFFDATLSSENDSFDDSWLSPPAVGFSGRRQLCFKLFQTEKNYVGILKTIISRFEEQIGRSLLSPTERRILFNNIPPIYDVHYKLLNDLFNLMINWNEERSLGSIILRHAPDLLKAYPPFVNFFENTREMLSMCDRSKPMFHAFLKIRQHKPECGRQSLSELLIQPIQRIPNIISLLNDIQEHTHESNSDHPQLEEAIVALKEVLKNINENKRKTEEHVAMFDIVNGIDNCPPNLLSSHRAFVSKVDVFEISNSIGTKGDILTIFLFTDMMEICKKRKKNVATTKSPSTASLAASKNRAKVYKHLELVPLSSIKRVVNINETEQCKLAFSLVCQSNQELKEKLYVFAMASSNVNKLDWIETLSGQLANTVCRADVENFLTTLEPHELDIETSEVNSNWLPKTMSRLASKTSRRVTRAFSFNRTPRP